MLIVVIVMVLLAVGATVERWLLKHRPERLLALSAPADERRVELGEAQAERARDTAPETYRENQTAWSAARLEAPGTMTVRGATWRPPIEGEQPGWIHVRRRGQPVGVGRVGLAIEEGTPPRLVLRLALFPMAALWVAGMVVLMAVVFFWFAAPLVALGHTLLTALFFGLPVWSHHAETRRLARPALDAVARRYAEPESATAAAAPSKSKKRGRAKKTKKRAKR